MSKLAAPNERLAGVKREKFAVIVAEQYASGLTIREVANIQGRSYGNIHRILSETGQPLRRRGGRRSG